VTRFSRLALASVAVLAVTGAYQSWRGLGGWASLAGTAYGRILLAKLAAVALLLTAAAFSRRWTARPVTVGAEAVGAEAVASEAVVRARVPKTAAAAPRGTRGPDGPPTGEPDAAPYEPPAAEAPYRRALRRSVPAEAVVGAVVLMITTVLTGTPPARAQTEATAGTAGAAGTGGLPGASVTRVPFGVGGARGTVQVTLDPGRVGDNSVEAVVYGPDGGFATVPELRVAFSLPDRDIGPLDARVTDRGGYWAADTVALPLPGAWTMKVTVRVSEVDQVSETRTVRIAP
jgi:copper transport protein